MNNSGLSISPEQLAALCLKSEPVIGLVRAIPRGDNQYMDRLYHYGSGIIPGSVVQAVLSADNKNPQMSSSELSEYMLKDEQLVKQLEANLRWEYSVPDMAEKLQLLSLKLTSGRVNSEAFTAYINFEASEGIKAKAPTFNGKGAKATQATDESTAGVCRHHYDKKRFSCCPYCNPPAYEEFCACRLKRMYLSSRAVAGDYKYVELSKGRLKYAQGFRGSELIKKKVSLSVAELEALSRAVIDCHIESWHSYDSSKPTPLGISWPLIEIEFDNGKMLAWKNSASPQEAALVRLEEIISNMLGLEFHLNK